LDPKWRSGNYPDSDPPIEGLTAALKTVTLHANQSEWAATFGHAPAVPGRDPAQALSHRFAIDATLDEFAAMRALTADANNFLYLIRANQLARADPRQIKAPTLILYSPTDLVFPQHWGRAHGGGYPRSRHAGRHGATAWSERSPQWRSAHCAGERTHHGIPYAVEPLWAEASG
jgi:homoserine acetyltransferase